jgi:hypothetical protein
MISVGFARVSKKRPCRICGKPTYCGFSRDEGTSICMRISAGSRGLSRNGGNIHVHPEIPFITIRPKIKNATSQIASLAPLEIRDAVFREMIKISPASNYREELVTGPNGLLSRGLLEQHTTSYGALPPSNQQRAILAGILNDYVRANFPEHAQSHSGAGIVGVPGFWQELSGMVHIWKPRNYLMPLLVIPYKDANGLIQACQIRLHANDISFNEKRYCWLSSPQERFGTSSGTPIHFTFVKEKLPPGETVLITEGALKADTVVRFRPNARVIATAGVTCSHSELVEAARPYTALIAFDADYRTNPAVCLQFARLIVQRVNDSKEQLRSTTNVLCWNGPKGIDDAVRANVRLRSLTISEWYATSKQILEQDRFQTLVGHNWRFTRITHQIP